MWTCLSGGKKDSGFLAAHHITPKTSSQDWSNFVSHFGITSSSLVVENWCWEERDLGVQNGKMRIVILEVKWASWIRWGGRTTTFEKQTLAREIKPKDLIRDAIIHLWEEFIIPTVGPNPPPVAPPHQLVVPGSLHRSPSTKPHKRRTTTL